uniref:response regulator n=1 Tax=Bradyrhizobium agreste TaxID=2751811 RepID=UPI001FE63168|nr:response regulator [Bradyrhizobium agreste]
MDKRTIMIVDDDWEIRPLLADLQTREGYATICLENGAAMDRALMQANPDLILLDIMLPGEDGLSICRRLRGRGGGAQRLKRDDGTSPRFR